MSVGSQARRRGRPRKKAESEVAPVQRQRLEVIERAAFWGGSVGRQVLVDAFSLHKNHVSKDFNLYEEIAPANLMYDNRAKCYLPSASFQPKLAQMDPSAFLQELLLSEGRTTAERLASLGVAIEVASVPQLQAKVTGDVLAEFTRAMARQSGLVVRYQSLRSDEPKDRIFWPHTLVNSGYRWLGRGWDETQRGFIYLAVGRVLDVQPREAPPPAGPKSDTLWNEYRELEVIPGRWLSRSARQVVAMEYGMTQEGDDYLLRLPVRRAMVAFALDRLRLRPGDSGPRKGLPIELRNMADVLQDDRKD